MRNLNSCIDRILSDKTASVVAVKVGKGDETLCEVYRSDSQCIDRFTRFDMASITKILATTTLSLIAIDKGLLNLNAKAQSFFSCNCANPDMTVFHLLTHTTGIGPKAFNYPENNYDNIAEFILNMPNEIPVGSEVIYTCQGFVLLHKILEKIFGKRFDVLFDELVCKPLGMEHTSFCPVDKTNIINSNLNDCDVGIVNDENSRHIGGIAGNAGVFSCINDLTKYVRMLLDKGYPLIGEKIFEAAVRNYTPQMSESRGLGFLYVDDRYEQTGKLFQKGSFGHCGHTGQSMFVDPQSGLYVIILSDATVTVHKKCGKENYPEVMAMRAAIHNAIKSDLNDN